MENVDLSSQFSKEYFHFSGSRSQKSDTTAVKFTNCLNTVDFIPEAVYRQFSKLKEILIENSNMPILKNGFFSDPFRNLQFVLLGDNKLHTIEDRAFSALPKLKYVGIYNNELETINSKIFANNANLEVVRIFRNKIKSLNPNIFRNLNKLKVLDLESNECVNMDFGCGNCRVSQTEINDGLRRCFENCRSDATCNSHIEATA